MPENNNQNKKMPFIDRSEDSLDRGSISNSLNSDNAFNDSGLENAKLLNQALKKGKSK